MASDISYMCTLAKFKSNAFFSCNILADTIKVNRDENNSQSHLAPTYGDQHSEMLVSDACTKFIHSESEGILL